MEGYRHPPAFVQGHHAYEDSQPGVAVYAKNEAGWDLPAHVIQLHPVYPCELLNLHSDSTALQLARNTLYYYAVDQQGFTETMNELGLSAFVMGTASALILIF